MSKVATMTAPERWRQKVPDSRLPERYQPVYRLGPWVLATSGHVMIAERGERPELPELFSANPLGWLGNRAGPVGTYSAKALRRWCRASWSESEVVSHHCNCEFCTRYDAEELVRVTEPEPEYIRFRGRPFNANKLGQAFSVLPDGPVELYLQEHRNGTPVILCVTVDVVALIVGCRNDSQTANAPETEPAA